MAKNKWLLTIAALMVTVSMSAQFPGFGNPAQFARQQAAKKAAEAEKNYQKGNELLEAKKYDKAFAAYEKAATDGHAGAQYNVAAFYMEGNVVPKDINKALEWYEKAANQGLKDAQFNLATIYHQGAGVPKDEEKAEYWAKVYKDIIKLEPKKDAAPPAFPFPPRQMGPVDAVAPSEDEIYDVADVNPKFPGGEQAMMQWLGRSLSYPEAALDEGIQGKVLVSFVIANEGSVVMPKIVKSVHPLLDAEAMRVLLTMPKWSPGMNKGKPVYTRYTLPVTFRLAGDDPEKTTAEDDASANASNQDYFDEAIEKAEQNPQFPGGEEALMQWLKSNLVYPPLMSANGIQGRVLIQFVVNKDGSIVEPSILRSVHPLIDAEAMRVVLNMPKWSPGIVDGKPVRVRFTMPLNFRIQ